MKVSLVWVIILAFVLAAGWSCHERSVGALNLRIAQLEQEKARVDTVYRRDTVTLTRVRHKTDSVLIAQTDTVIRTDTVRLLLAAERNACNAVIQSCEDRVAVRDSIIKVLKKKPSVFSKIPYLVGGYLIHEVIH